MTDHVYQNSKYALEGLSQSLAAELDPAWGISITILEPGVFQHPCDHRRRRDARSLPAHPAYTDAKLASAQARAFFGGGVAQTIGGDPAKAARAIYGIARDARCRPARSTWSGLYCGDRGAARSYSEGSRDCAGVECRSQAHEVKA